MAQFLKKNPDREYSRLFEGCDHIHVKATRWLSHDLLEIHLIAIRSGEYSRKLRLVFSAAHRRIAEKTTIPLGQNQEGELGGKSGQTTNFGQEN
jgi:hypothetical protein